MIALYNLGTVCGVLKVEDICSTSMIQNSNMIPIEEGSTENENCISFFL